MVCLSICAKTGEKILHLPKWYQNSKEKTKSTYH